MKKFLVGIVTLVAAVMLSSPAFGALSTVGYPVADVGTFYFDVGIGVDKEMFIDPPPNEANVIKQLNDANWGTSTFSGNITFSEKDDGAFGFINEVEFEYPVQIVVVKWGGNQNTQEASYAFLLDGYTKEFGWNLSVENEMSHYSGYNAVPVPAAVWLLGSGVLGLVAVRRRRS